MILGLSHFFYKRIVNIGLCQDINAAFLRVEPSEENLCQLVLARLARLVLGHVIKGSTAECAFNPPFLLARDWVTSAL